MDELVDARCFKINWQDCIAYNAACRSPSIRMSDMATHTYSLTGKGRRPSTRDRR